MNVVLIGSGNVATVLGKLIKKSGHTIIEIVSRNEARAKNLAATVNANYHTDLKQINTTAGIYIIAVADDAINDIAADLNLADKIVVHTAGSVLKDVLKDSSKNYGIFYPLQSLRKENEEIPVIPFLVDASNEETLHSLQQFAQSLSDKVAVADDAQRSKLHVAAVIASNFSNYIFTLTNDYCKKENIFFNILLPLIQETVSRLNDFAPADVQTGPAIRGDKNTMQKHLALLQEHPELKKLYEIMSEGIITYHEGDKK